MFGIKARIVSPFLENRKEREIAVGQVLGFSILFCILVTVVLSWLIFNRGSTSYT